MMVSPGLKSGSLSVARSPLSSWMILFIAHAAPLEQLRAAQPRATERLLQSPAGYRRVIARRQYGRHIAAIEGLRPRVVRPIHQTVAEGLLQRRFRTAQRTRHQSRDRIDDHQRRQLAARQHIVADGPLLIDLLLDEALVDPFIAS